MEANNFTMNQDETKTNFFSSAKKPCKNFEEECSKQKTMMDNLEFEKIPRNITEMWKTDAQNCFCANVFRSF